MVLRTLDLRKLRILSLIAFLLSAFVYFPLEAGEKLTRVKSRKVLRCGVSTGRLGFSDQDAKQRWSGLDVDFCRAIAAAVIGDPESVRFFPLATAARFIALRSNEIDVLARNTTWTIGREVGLGVHFVGTLYYDGQSFMVPSKGRANKISDLRGARICVLERTTTEENLADYFGSRGWTYQAVTSKTMDEASENFFAGQCAAYSADRSELAAARVSRRGAAQAYVILPEQISKEPLAPAIKRGDEEWLLLLRWVYFTIIGAEELGVSNKNIRAKLQVKADARLAKFLDTSGEFAKFLGIERGWVARILDSVGNYGEMFDRNLGQGSVLKLERGLNRLWTQGGLMYAPPLS